MTAKTPIVHLVDDDESFLRGAARLLRASGYTVKSYPSAAAFLALADADAPGCVLVDLQMPGMGGLELQREMAAAGSDLPLVFLTGQGDIPSSVQAMRLGAEDFLTKTAAKMDLLNAVQRALDRNAREREAHARRTKLRARFDSLTPREREVLAQVIAGQLNKQIAGDFDVTERSVKRHRTSIMAKLHVQSVAELVRLVADAGLLVDGRFLP